MLTAFSFLSNHSKYIDVTHGQKKTFVFDLAKSLAGKTRDAARYNFVYPANEKEMLELIQKRFAAYSSKGVRVSEHCTKYEFGHFNV